MKTPTKLATSQTSKAPTMPMTSNLSLLGSRRAWAEAGGPSSGEGAGPRKIEMAQMFFLSAGAAVDKVAKNEAAISSKKAVTIVVTVQFYQVTVIILRLLKLQIAPGCESEGS